MIRTSIPLAALLLGIAASGCAGTSASRQPSMDGATGPSSGDGAARATAVLAPASGSSVKGTVTFVTEGGGVRVVGDLEGLARGTHGFHVHERGDCSAPDAESAGDHFAADAAQPHGAPEAPARHTGDLGNIEADAHGRARFERLDPVIALSGPRSIVGRAVVVHEKRDDLATQPGGDAGARVACGVVAESR